jgi:hypothetical protein
MDLFQYRDNGLCCEDVRVSSIVEEVGTPVYIYSGNTFLNHYRRIEEAFRGLDPMICFSIKACSNLAILKVLRKAGAGFDVVSGGELFRAERAGVRPKCWCAATPPGSSAAATPSTILFLRRPFRRSCKCRGRGKKPGARSQGARNQSPTALSQNQNPGAVAGDVEGA